MKKGVLILVFLVGLWAAKGQDTVHGYVFTYGTDPAMWLERDSWDTVQTSSLAPSTRFVDLGFNFNIGDRGFRRAALSKYGQLCFSHPAMELSYRSRPLVRDTGLYAAAAPMLLAYGCSAGNVRWSTEGTRGHKVFVLEYEDISAYGSTSCQYQLYEEDGSIVFAYHGDNPPLNSQVGMILDTLRILVVNAMTHECMEGPWETPQEFFAYPGINKYYRFTPITFCRAPADLCPQEVGIDQARMVWKPISAHVEYTLEYGPTGFDAGSGTTVTTYDNNVMLTNLDPGTCYEARLWTTQCDRVGTTDSTPSIEVLHTYFNTYCESHQSNTIDYANLYDPSVVCRVGTFQGPDAVEYVHNRGMGGDWSRHCVIGDTTKLDGDLRCVPSGYCSSVRLGDMNAGGMQESVEYTFTVDTFNFNYLLLHYALVQNNPRHIPEQQPKFIMTVTDMDDNLINTCYEVEFVGNTATSGAGQSGDVGWSTLGLNLRDYQDLQLKVKLSNFDCALREHDSHVYFVLDGKRSAIKALQCGEEMAERLFAPEGFSYRWYREDNPTLTLGTNEWLDISAPGVYKCDLAFLYNSNCMFTLTYKAGSRYPMARFSMMEVGNCGKTIQFLNTSVVTTDAAHTHETGEGCDSYMWVFSDGYSTTAVSPRRTMTPGVHWATLYATLADGGCTDSTTVCFVVPDLTEDTQRVDLCKMEPYAFRDTVINDTGYFCIERGCSRYHLFLRYHPQFYEADTFNLCMGDTLFRHGQVIDEPGDYHFAFLTTAGCDSIYDYQLTLRPYPEVTLEKDRVCDNGLAFVLTATEGDYNYVWNSSPADSSLTAQQGRAEVRLTPQEATNYWVEVSHPDEPHCPVTLWESLPKLEPVKAMLEVEPKNMEFTNLNFRAWDRSVNADGRNWYVNYVMQESHNAMLSATAEPGIKELVVMLEALDGNCADTATDTIFIVSPSIYFPNIFTPTLSTNNTFGPICNDLINYELWIYDRRGILIFHGDENTGPWNGESANGPCRQETYVYTCKYTTPLGETKRMTGNVTLVR